MKKKLQPRINTDGYEKTRILDFYVFIFVRDNSCQFVVYTF